MPRIGFWICELKGDRGAAKLLRCVPIYCFVLKGGNKINMLKTTDFLYNKEFCWVKKNDSKKDLLGPWESEVRQICNVPKHWAVRANRRNNLFRLLSPLLLAILRPRICLVSFKLQNPTTRFDQITYPWNQKD